jgi:hypothetical protein
MAADGQLRVWKNVTKVLTFPDLKSEISFYLALLLSCIARKGQETARYDRTGLRPFALMADAHRNLLSTLRLNHA